MFDASEAHLPFEQWVKRNNYMRHYLEIATGMLLPISTQGEQIQKAWERWQVEVKNRDAVQPLIRR